MAISELKWDPKLQILTGCVTRHGSRVLVQIPRDLIHTIGIYNDAIESEIERHKEDIAARLLPIILSQVQSGEHA